MYVCMYVCICVFVCMYVCMYVCMCVLVRVLSLCMRECLYLCPCLWFGLYLSRHTAYISACIDSISNADRYADMEMPQPDAERF